MSKELTSFSATKLAKLITGRKISSSEVVSAFIEKIKTVNPQVNAVVAFDPDSALKEAKKIDKKSRSGHLIHPLLGVPCTIKDSIDVKGFVGAAGLVGRKKFIPTADATIVTKLKNAGAIILGKTNTPELTMSFHTTNLVYGTTKNPLNEKMTPGGSSGGAAAIVALKGSPFDVGSDTGGSIRWPAHCCGVYGLKPTAGRIARTGHIIDFHPANQSLTTLGPIANSIDDIELIYSVISGPDGVDPYVVDMPIKNSLKIDVSKLRVAYFINNGIFAVSEDITLVIEKTIRSLRKNKIHAKLVTPQGIETTAQIFKDFVNTGDWLKRIFDRYGATETSLPWLASSPDPSSSEYNKIFEAVSAYRSSMLAFWNQYDVLICPVAPSPAIELNLDYPAGFHSYNTAFNISGDPSLVMPMDFSKNLLPVGIQIVAPNWREDICLAVGRFIEKCK
jgi:amidase